MATARTTDRPSRTEIPPPIVRSSSSEAHDGSPPRYAFVTLLTSDAYLPGALVLASSLRKAHAVAGNPPGTLSPADLASLGPAGLSRKATSSPASERPEGAAVDLVCFVTPATVSISSIRTLLRHFDKVVGVEPLSFASLAAAHAHAQVIKADARSRTAAADARAAAKKIRRDTRQKLALLGRPDLAGSAGAPLTKLHAWRLTGYNKVVYLDADMLVLKPIAHLFSISAHLAAAPDIGWPDAFNSGLLVLTPDLATFGALREYAVSSGSWDGADQGLLNDYFGGEIGTADVGAGGGWQRLPFRYNVTPNAGYTFVPAYHRYGGGIMAAHFIGASKPWDMPRPSGYASRTGPTSFNNLVNIWYDVLEQCYPTLLHSKTANTAEVVHTERGVEVIERNTALPIHEAIWNIDADERRRAYSATSKAPTPSNSSSRSSRAGNVEDLKEMFGPHIVTASAAAELESLSLSAAENPGLLVEGIYLSLPLDGRNSLIPSELESSDDEKAKRNDQKFQKDKGQDWSPPKLSWDPAREPPPLAVGQTEYQMRNPVDTYFSNVWDMPSAAQPRGKQAFFEAAKHAEAARQRTLSKLQREHFFDNLGSEQPDTRKVQAVFPWEGKTTSATRSSRIFPDEDPFSVVPGSQGQNASLEAASGHAPERRFSGSEEDSPERWQSAYGANAALGPGDASRGGFPSTISYVNAWDKVESIRQRGRAGSGSDNIVRASVPGSASQHGSRVNQGSQTASARYRSRGAQVEGGRAGASGGGNHRRPADTLSNSSENVADQSGDGDNESSSSSDDEVVENRGSKWRKAGPGPGYQRKAEFMHQAAGTSPRSPRHGTFASLGSSPVSHGATGSFIGSGGSSSGSTVYASMDMSFAGSNAYSEGRISAPHSRSSSMASDRLAPPLSPQFPTRTSSRRQTPYTGSDTLSFDPSLSSTSDFFYDAHDTTMSMMASPDLPRRHRGATYGAGAMGEHQSYSVRSPPGSGANSGASSPSAVATPTNLSPSHSRADLRPPSRTMPPAGVDANAAGSRSTTGGNARGFLRRVME